MDVVIVLDDMNLANELSAYYRTQGNEFAEQKKKLLQQLEDRERARMQELNDRIGETQMFSNKMSKQYYSQV